MWSVAQAGLELALCLAMTLNLDLSSSTSQALELQAYVIMVKTDSSCVLGQCAPPTGLQDQSSNDLLFGWLAFSLFVLQMSPRAVLYHVSCKV